MPDMEKLKKADLHYFWILFIEEVSWPFSWLRVQFIEIWSKISFQDLLLEGKIGYSVSSLPQAFGAIWDWSMTKYLNYGLVPRGQGGAWSQILTHCISWTPYCLTLYQKVEVQTTEIDRIWWYKIFIIFDDNVNCMDCMTWNSLKLHLTLTLSSPGVHLTFTLPSDHHLTFPWPLPNLNSQFTAKKKVM